MFENRPLTRMRVCGKGPEDLRRTQMLRKLRTKQYRIVRAVQKERSFDFAKCSVVRCKEENETF